MRSGFTPDFIKNIGINLAVESIIKGIIRLSRERHGRPLYLIALIVESLCLLI